MKRNLLPLFLFCYLFLKAQTPCENGLAGNYPCHNYDLMSSIPISTLANSSGTPEGSDIWGWTDPLTSKEYALVCTTNSTAFVDITDPINPVFLGRLDSENGKTNTWRDVKIYEDHAYIVADEVGNHGMQVFDLTRLRNITSPQNFTSDAVFSDVGSCHNIVINENSAVAYLVGCDTYDGGPVFVDISDPKNPVSIGVGGYSIAGYSHDAQVVTYNGPDSDYTGREIYIGSNGDKVSILDVTDKDNIIKIKDVYYSQIGYTHQGWFTEDQRFFILGDEFDEFLFGFDSRTIVFDMQDLDDPFQSSTYLGPTDAIDHNGYVKGNEYFLANYSAGLRVLDISNIASSTNSMTEVGFFDTYIDDDRTTFNGLWSVYPFFKSGNIIISDKEGGLFIVRKSGTLHTDSYQNSLGFNLYPNPTTESTTIELTLDKKIKNIDIYDILGKKVLNETNINQQKKKVDLSQLSSGVYLLKVNQQFSKKLIIH